MMSGWTLPLLNFHNLSNTREKLDQVFSVSHTLWTVFPLQIFLNTNTADFWCTRVTRRSSGLSWNYTFCSLWRAEVYFLLYDLWLFIVKNTYISIYSNHSGCKSRYFMFVFIFSPFVFIICDVEIWLFCKCGDKLAIFLNYLKGKPGIWTWLGFAKSLLLYRGSCLWYWDASTVANCGKLLPKTSDCVWGRSARARLKNFKGLLR